MIKNILLVGLGSFAGGVMRYLVTLLFQSKPVIAYPYATFLVNAVGCLLAGILLGWLQKTQSVTGPWGFLLIVGFCGGFTTFSAFAVENMALLKNNSYFLFATYTILSVACGLLFVYVGFLVSKWF